MVGLKRVLVIDGSTEMQQLYDGFIKKTEYEICGCTSDGITGLRMIEDLRPDIVVMEIILPRMDGLELLDCISRDKNILRKPATLVISAASRADIIESAFQSGAGYYMVKPVTKDAFLRRLARVAAEQSDGIDERTDSFSSEMSISSYSGLEEQVTQLLRAIAMPPHVKGYQYLRDSIMIVSERKDSINSITKVLYPTVAKMNNTTTSSVERAVRHAIRITFDREHTRLLDDLFAYSLGKTRKHPTSAEFIAVMADRIRLTREASSPQYLQLRAQ